VNNITLVRPLKQKADMYSNKSDHEEDMEGLYKASHQITIGNYGGSYIRLKV